MSQETTTLTFEQTVAVPATAVYFAFTNAGMVRQWLCNNSQISPREGGRIYLYWQQGYYASGEFTKLVPNETIAFTWQGRNEPFVTQVNVSLSEADDTTAVTLTHSDVPTGDDWAELRQELSKGWETGLENLRSVLEKGVDKRVYDRPFMGILIGGVVSAEDAQTLGLPIAGGIRLGGTLADTGAALAGLQTGDIIVNVGGNETKDFPTLQTAMQPLKIEDKVKVTYYRDGEKASTNMTIMPRPVPEIPATAVAFAATLEEIYAQINDALDASVADASDAEADYRPSDDAWNAKEILAHVITTERGVQMGLATRVTQGVLDGFPNNPNAWVRSVTAVHPTLASMVQAWKETAAETVALVAALPDEFMAQKVHILNEVNNLITGLPGHTHGHIVEIKALLAAAREQLRQPA